MKKNKIGGQVVLNIILIVMALMYLLPFLYVISVSTKGANDATQAPAVSSEPIVLEWYYRGNGIQKDTELVETEFNKLLQTYPGMENVTVNFNCYTGADYPNAVALAQSADQQIDILNTVGLDFVDQVKLGTYAPLDDLLADNQALYNELPEWLWDLGTVDGSIYMVPHYQRATNMEYMVIPTEYLTKYGYIDYCPYGSLHSTGMLECEAPTFTVANKRVIEENMAICIDAYFKGMEWGSFRIEDCYLITKDGAKRMTTYNDKAIPEIFK